MRRSLVVTVALLCLAALLVGGPSLLVSTSTDAVSPDETEVTPKMVSLEDSESRFWRYLSPQERFQQRSPINVVVRGETDEVVRAMTESGDGDWEELNESEEAEADPETYAITSEERRAATDIEWGETTGATRYAWVDPGTHEDGRWTTETLQLHDGDYYGQRYHVRLYASPNEADQWVAMQTHSEHFDWFTLRHRVDGSQAAQRKVESDFMNHPQVDVEEDVRRMYLDNRNSADADGWATVVDLAGMLVVPAMIGVGAGSRIRRNRAAGSEGVTDDRVSRHAPDAIDDRLTDVDRRRIAAAYDRLEAGHILLVFTILALFLGVRIMGLALERRVGFLTAHQIAALLYPVIGVGIPLATYLLARGLTRRLDAALVAAGSLATAIWLDYGLLGVDAIPIDVVVQRMLVVVALGLIAGGAAKRAARKSTINDMLLAGTAMWVLVLVGTLFGYL